MKKRKKAQAETPLNTGNDHTTVGHGRNIKDGRSMKTSEQIADGGNMEDRDDFVANEESPVLVQNIADVNLSTEKKRNG